MVVFNFLMPWVLRMSRGRYRMEGDQRRDSGPANRIHVQVEIFCYHRASRVYSSVQGPQNGLGAHAKSSLISQMSLYPKISCSLPLLQFSSQLHLPLSVGNVHWLSSQLSVAVALLFIPMSSGAEKKEKKNNSLKIPVRYHVLGNVLEQQAKI